MAELLVLPQLDSLVTYFFSAQEVDKVQQPWGDLARERFPSLTHYERSPVG
jgi:hypothetical protein